MRKPRRNSWCFSLVEITEEEEETTALSANEEAGNASVSVPEAGDVISERQANDSSGSADLSEFQVFLLFFMSMNALLVPSLLRPCKVSIHVAS